MLERRPSRYKVIALGGRSRFDAGRDGRFRRVPTPLAADCSPNRYESTRAFCRFGNESDRKSQKVL
ncbi:hypothetical protein EA472_19050 [Natrarchaeobius oligotrophus]|uniref:Uncharacterized protein n=1 Tax=Natrarchaeobius chitinivorans TaxID=1679083 RepID=A0A3N6MN22_NATCH|nr:hypothetical protein EA472_19050 [Natrarchaeobius chitinivorans]